MMTGHSVETQDFLTKRAYALSSYALTCVALTELPETNSHLLTNHVAFDSVYKVRGYDIDVSSEVETLESQVQKIPIRNNALSWTRGPQAFDDSSPSHSGYSAEGGAVDRGCSGLGQYYIVNQCITSYKSLHPVSTAPPFAECRHRRGTLKGVQTVKSPKCPF